MHALILSLLLTASGPERVRVAVPALTLINVEPSMNSFYATSLAQHLTYQGIDVLTSVDLAAVMGLERQRQLMGCADDGCRINLAASLDVDAVVSAQVAHVGTVLKLDVRLLKPGSGKLLASASATADDSEQLTANLDVVSAELARQVSAALGRTLTINPNAKLITRWSTVKKLSLLGVGLSVAAGVTGAVFLSQAQASYSTLQSATVAAPLTPDATNRAVTTGQFQQTLGVTGIALAGGFLVAAAVMFFFGGEETIHVADWLLPATGGALAFSWGVR